MKGMENRNRKAVYCYWIVILACFTLLSGCRDETTVEINGEYVTFGTASNFTLFVEDSISDTLGDRHFQWEMNEDQYEVEIYRAILNEETDIFLPDEKEAIKYEQLQHKDISKPHKVKVVFESSFERTVQNNKNDLEDLYLFNPSHPVKEVHFKPLSRANFISWYRPLEGETARITMFEEGINLEMSYEINGFIFGHETNNKIDTIDEKIMVVHTWSPSLFDTPEELEFTDDPMYLIVTESEESFFTNDADELIEWIYDAYGSER